MPDALTIFAAKYLVFVDAAIAVAVLGFILNRWPRPALLRWGITAVIVLILSYAFAKIGGALYNNPRPFAVDHIKPLVSHGPDNGFPSDHALLAAAIVALVVFAEPWVAVPFGVIAVLVDWGRVGSGLHHVIDVVGSDVFVALAAFIALLVTPTLVAGLARRVPRKLLDREEVAHR